MKIDWEEFNRMTDEEKVAFMRRVRDADLEATKDKSLPSGTTALEKARSQEGFEVIGYEKPDGTVHYYADEEQPSQSDDEQAPDDHTEPTAPDDADRDRRG